MDPSSFAAEVPFPQPVSGGEHAPSYVPLGRPLMATEGSNAAHEEAGHLAPEEGGSSHGNPGFRHVLPPTDTSYSASWQPGPAAAGWCAHNFSTVSSGENANEDQHEVMESLQCTGDQQVVPVTAECSQPQSVQSTSSSALVTLFDSQASRRAVDVYSKLCSTMNEEMCIGLDRPLRGKHHAMHRATFAEVDSNRVKLKEGLMHVPLHVPFPCLSIEEFLDSSSSKFLVENGGLWIMSALFQYVRTLGKCHGIPELTGAMYGAISKLSNILASHMTGRREEPCVCLLPCLDNFVKAIEKVSTGRSEKEVVREGRLLDIKALGCVLDQVLPLIREREKLHVSVGMQGNLERALQLSKEASTGDQMALIARTLHCDRRLAMLYLEGLPNTVDIVCYEGEKILRVLDEWLISCGCLPLSAQPQFQLQYTGDSRCHVLRDNEVCYPQSSVTLVRVAFEQHVYIPSQDYNNVHIWN